MTDAPLRTRYKPHNPAVVQALSRPRAGASPHQETFHNVHAVDGPHPKVDAPPAAIRHEVGENVILPDADRVHLERLELLAEGQRDTVHDARGADLR